ncbi:hypothetical protein APS67_005796 [Streptomyces sp. AVP053U2]|nr:hypothetical protein APS67_005796 [Streptomyces sp. AVP053U2]
MQARRAGTVVEDGSGGFGAVLHPRAAPAPRVRVEAVHERPVRQHCEADRVGAAVGGAPGLVGDVLALADDRQRVGDEGVVDAPAGSDHTGRLRAGARLHQDGVVLGELRQARTPLEHPAGLPLPGVVARVRHGRYPGRAGPAVCAEDVHRLAGERYGRVVLGGLPGDRVVVPQLRRLRREPQRLDPARSLGVLEHASADGGAPVGDDAVGPHLALPGRRVPVLRRVEHLAGGTADPVGARQPFPELQGDDVRQGRVLLGRHLHRAVGRPDLPAGTVRRPAGQIQTPRTGVGDEQHHGDVRGEPAQRGVEGEQFGEHVDGYLARGAVEAAYDDPSVVALRHHDVRFRLTGAVPWRGAHVAARQAAVGLADHLADMGEIQVGDRAVRPVAAPDDPARGGHRTGG